MTDPWVRQREETIRRLQVTPGGAQTMSKQAARFPGAFPTTLSHGAGATVWDTDGREYIDWICGLASMTLGYGHSGVQGAVGAALRLGGASWALPHRLEARVAEQLVDWIPCAEMVRFTKTGSEACSGAVRIARAATGRDRVVVCGYHGWHDWYIASMPQHQGVPDALGGLVTKFRYNDFDSLVEATAGDGTPVAAIMLEPTLIESPAPNFLEAVRLFATKIGAVLIFDEMVTGFRWHPHGAQTLYNVIPDLAVFGKALGNGYPIAAIVGSRALMEDAGQLISGTYGGETIGLAAAGAVLDAYGTEHPDPCERMAEAGAQVFRRLRAERDSLFEIVGQVYHPVLRPRADRAVDANLAQTLLVQELAKAGVLIHPVGFNVSAALTNEDLAVSLSAFAAATARVTRWWEAGHDLSGYLDGARIQPSGFRPVT